MPFNQLMLDAGYRPKIPVGNRCIQHLVHKGIKRYYTLILHESEAFICKTLKGEAIDLLLRALNNAADESLRLAL